ncbi:MAG: hypothetical protein ABS35_15425 [Kaistia sp. SCN 65-12]|nr:MAG: hypothetical protein ABS35_15425 [Kaistia sp. SCN 65-12]
MNIRLIRDLLVDAVRLDRETQEHIGPARLRAQQISYGHVFADMAGWGKVPNDPHCQLRREDGDPYATIRSDFWDQFDRDPTAAEISRADAVHGWLMFVDKVEERRALLAWASSRVGGTAFRRWCNQIERISTTTGTKRKNRALDKIYAELQRRPVHDSRIRDFGELQPTPEIGDLSATIATAADEAEGLNNWAAADAIPIFEAEVPQSAFSWAAKRNERRRRQRAKRAAKKREEK